MQKGTIVCLLGQCNVPSGLERWLQAGNEIFKMCYYSWYLSVIAFISVFEP
jgi:hypothetical protein